LTDEGLLNELKEHKMKGAESLALGSEDKKQKKHKKDKKGKKK
jgi:hypothetical protein